MDDDNFDPSKSDGGEHDLHHILLDLNQEGKLEFHESRDEHGDPKMSMTEKGRGAAVGLLQENDDAVLYLLKVHFGQEFDSLDSVSERDVWGAIVDLAKTLKDDGVNLFRVLQRNFEKVPTIDVSEIPESIIQRFDPETGDNSDTDSCRDGGGE